jgi:NTE family protein
MNEALPQTAEKTAKRLVPFERVALVLQGGGALGAYQAGVFQALAEAEIEVGWLCGTSIGAVNGALIAGNAPDRRVERLGEFWEAVTEPPPSFPALPWLAAFPWTGADRSRALLNRMSAFVTMVQGVPNFFSPRAAPPLSSEADSPDVVSLYDATPLRETLERLVDYDLINSEPMRFSIGATNVRTGAPVYFDNTERRITADHIMASASLPPGLPPTEIDGEYYWDGGVVSNSPMQYVLDNRRDYSTGSAIAFEVDLWDANGEVPLDITSANLRALEIHSASRSNLTLEQYREMHEFQLALKKHLQQIPEDYRNTPEARLLAQKAGVLVATLVQLKYQAKKYETASKIFEFSRRSMREHWQAGYDDTWIALNEPSVLEVPDVSEGARIFDVHRGWIT